MLQTRILSIAEAHTEQLGYRPQLHFTGPLDRAVDKPLAADILAVTCEALSNCARHAAASTVTVSVAIDHDLLTLEITDNGHGIGTPTRPSGLSNMRRRAEKQRHPHRHRASLQRHPTDLVSHLHPLVRPAAG